MSAKGRDLVDRLENLQANAEQTLSSCTSEQWRMLTKAEGWTVAATAHHLAIVQRAFVGMVERFAAGETYTPSVDMNRVHETNADHAGEYAVADQDETFQILQSSGTRMAALFRGFSADDLVRRAGTFGGNDLTVAQVLDYVVIGHLREHLASVQDTIGAAPHGAE